MWYVLAIGVVLWIGCGNWLSPFAARKFVHIFAGLPLCHCNKPVGYLKWLVILIQLASIAISCTRPFPFGVKYDVGIISYNLIVLVFALFEQPFRVLLPLFICDPFASIVGRAVRSPELVRGKTLLGSLTVFCLSYITLYYVKEAAHRIALAVAITLTEAALSRCDNLGIAVVLIGYLACARKWGYPIDVNL